MEAAGFAAAAGVALTSASSAGAAPAAGGVQGTAKGVGLAKLAGGLGLTKLAGGVGLALVTAAAVVGLVAHRAGSTGAVPAAASAAPLAAATGSVSPASLPSTLVVSDAPPVAASAAGAASAGSRAPATTAATTATTVASSDALALEARLLEAARACTKARDYACASRELAAYDARFPRGMLSEEATLLQIDVARGRGDSPAARALAEHLLTTHPSGPYARRARAVLAELAPEETPP
jgi:hypothetical protein